MTPRRILSQLNIIGQCKKYRLPIWQCPQFLFLVMGILIVISILTVYNLATHYIDDPYIVLLIILFLTSFLFIVAFSVSQGFEKLAEASRIKSEFISIVSHQLRTPLSNLRWATEFLSSGRVSPLHKKQLDYFAILKENADRMEELVSELLVVSRIEQGKLPLKKQEVSLPEIIDDLILEFKPLVEASNAEIKFEEEGKIPKILADPSQIKVVLENLFDNAIRYSFSEEKGGLVEIRIGRKGESIYFEISDNGVGIPKEDQKYIFQKFFRSQSAMKHQTQGSGLGLFIVKSIIEAHKGKIGFVSEEGKGTTFWFTIPINQK